MFIQSGCRKVLLLAGDISSKMISKNDKTVSMVFGDAGSATLIENKSSKSYFDLGNDGSGYKDLIINDGGYRCPISKTSFTLKNIDAGIKRCDADLFMDGLSIMNFAIKRVPNSVKNVLNLSLAKKEDIDLFFLHQANEFMLKYLSKKMKIDYNKVPFEARKYGNTGPASIPLAMSSYFLNTPMKRKTKVLLSGFGVGLSWASSILELEKKIIFNIKSV
jgi:3-oxoacyl-[acyl-carrier-protein] synthase-3